MSRFSDDFDEDFYNQQALYAQATKNALAGKRGQAALKELAEALLALPEKKLLEGQLYNEKDEVCAVGAMAVHRKMKKGMTRAEAVAELSKKYGDDCHSTIDCGMADVGLLGCLAAEFAYINDEEACASTPEERYEIVLKWVREQIKVA